MNKQKYNNHRLILIFPYIDLSYEIPTNQTNYKNHIVLFIDIFTYFPTNINLYLKSNKNQTISIILYYYCYLIFYNIIL